MSPPPHEPSREELARRVEELEERLRLLRLQMRWPGRPPPESPQGRQLEEALELVELSRDRYADLYDFAPSAHLSFDPFGMVVELNLTASTLLAGERGRILGLPFLHFVLPEDRQLFLDHMQRCRRGEELVSTELRLKPPREEPETPVELLSRPFPAPDGAGYVYQTVVTDLTERRRAEAERQRLTLLHRTAQAESEAKDHFLAALSHELRTPLTPILSAVSELLESTDGLPERIRGVLDLVRRNVKMEARLIDDLLDVSRVRHGKLRLDRRPVEVHEVVAETLELFEPEVRESGLCLVVDLAAERSWVDGDGVRLSQVLSNLVKNAVKFTPAGGTVRIATDHPEPDRLRITVDDSGVGMSQEEMARLFKPFEQMDAESSRFGGLGLGLSISKELVQAHEGTVRAWSEGKGKGARFEVELPAMPAREIRKHEGRWTAACSATQDHPPRHGLKILLVEDHTDTRRTLAEILRLRGFEVVATGSLDAARAAAAGERVDLVVSDLGLPDGDGHELMRELSKNYGLTGVALSGFGSAEDKEKSRAAGFGEHLTKPVEMGDLLRVIDRLR